MSMAVDLSKPITAEEAAYLQARGRDAELQRAVALHGQPVPEAGAGDGTGPQMTPLGAAEQTAVRKERLLAELAAMGVEVEVKEDDTTPDDDSETLPPYETWKSNDLNAEIDRRNEGRPDGKKISKAGSVSERADRLYMDDEQA